VLAGGRYDGLVESLGGPHTPAVGWAAGVERLAMLVEEPSSQTPTFAIVVEDDELIELGIWFVATLRRRGAVCEMVGTGSSRKRFDKAAKLKPEAVISLNSILLDDGQLANLRVKNFVYGDSIRPRNDMVEKVLNERFKFSILTGSRIDSGSDVKLFDISK
jgi:histidyl-tRNA synthetase